MFHQRVINLSSSRASLASVFHREVLHLHRINAPTKRLSARAFPFLCSCFFFCFLSFKLTTVFNATRRYIAFVRSVGILPRGLIARFARYIRRYDPYPAATGFPFDRRSLPLYFSARLPRETAANECAHHKLFALACERAPTRARSERARMRTRVNQRMQRCFWHISIPRARRLKMIGSERRTPGKLLGALRRVPPVKPVGTESDGPSHPPVQAAALSGLQTYKETRRSFNMTVRQISQQVRHVLESISDIVRASQVSFANKAK